MNQVLVSITPEHIAAGKPGSGSECPIAQAMTAAPQLNADRADAQYDYIRAYSRPNTPVEQFIDYTPDDAVRDFQRNVDAERPVAPVDLIFCAGPADDHYQEAHCFQVTAENAGRCRRHQE